MAAHHDTGEFIDSDFHPAQPAAAQAAPGAPVPRGFGDGGPNRPPTREEIEAMVSEKQIKLAELKRAQEELERERAGLEELRRRQIEFPTGRAEMLQHLTRGIGLLEEAELNSRRDAEQMARTLAEFREAVSKVQSVNEQAWTHDNFSVELTRALTTIENARLEWNGARLKFPLLAGAPAADVPSSAKPAPSLLSGAALPQLLKIGLPLNWPLVLLGAPIFFVLLLRR